MLFSLGENGDVVGKTNVQFDFHAGSARISRLPGRETSHFHTPALEPIPILLGARKQEFSVPVKAEDQEAEAGAEAEAEAEEGQEGGGGRGSKQANKSTKQ